ncbi:MAG: AraC family transcriptional regulator [Halieaceae bacterium]|jgi:AraC-like DNA-binding protein|nr:AraC family transcriptional regulator [Halieaceae bacterium]
MSSSTPAAYALILVDLAGEAGVDHEALLAGSSLADASLAGVGARVADEDFRILVDNALRQTNDAALGLKLGQRLNLGAHALLGQAFLTCRDLAEVIDLFERYYHVLASDLVLEFERGEERMTVFAVATDSHMPLQFGLECMAAAMRNTLAGLLGGRELPLRFEFPYPAPPHAASYREILGGDLYFDRPRAAWSFPVSHLATPLPSSNPALRQLYEAECERLLSDLRSSDDLAARSRRLLRKLEGQYPQMPQLARMLNVSARTYRRRLADLGTSYQQLLDEVRAEHASRLLENSHLPIASIAYRLGFSDPSNFRRAFRAWTGHSPAAARERARTGATLR